MIVYRDKKFMRRDNFPDTDWVGDADWVLNDNDPADAEIEEKIIRVYPNFDFVFDDDGNIADVVATEPVHVETTPTDHERLEALEAAFIEFVASSEVE